MVGMRIIAGPEEFVLTDQARQGSDGPFSRVGRNITLALKLVRRFFFQANGRAERRTAENRISTIQEVADPAGL